MARERLQHELEREIANTLGRRSSGAPWREFTSHIMATATLSIPFMIITETALSFLGLGLREPAISWGVLL